MPALDDAATVVSVVLPACGRMDLLDRALDALMRQSIDPRCVEIVVVDTEPNHNTLHLVAGWRTRTLERGPRLVYIANPGPGSPSAARNHGWRAAQSPIVAFTTDDAVADPHWLEHGLAACNGTADVVCGRIDTPLPARPTDHQRSAHAHVRAPFTSANCFIRKPVLELLGGFDERFSGQRGSDADLYFRLIEHGMRIVRAPQALAVHPVRPAPWGASLLQIRHAVYDALLYKKHPLLYRERVEPRPNWMHYLIVAALLALLVGLAMHSTLLAWAGGGAWLWLTASLCLQRLRGTTHSPSHIAEMAITSMLLPPLAVFWRLFGALRFRVRFA